MKYDVQDISPVERKISVTVPAEEANAAILTTIALYKTKYDVKGFRKGKAPASVIEGKFRGQIYNEATTDLINYHINDILNQLKLTPMSRINVDAGLLARDEEFTYTLGFEIAPQFDLPTYIGLDVDEERVEVKDEEVAEVERRILDNQAKPKVISDVREPKDGEIVTVSFGAYRDGEVISGIKAENFELTLGEGQALPEFEELIKTLTTGQSGEKDITFPADFINTELAGQTVTMKITLHAVKVKELPEMGDDVAKKAGFENLEKMREAIRQSYQESRKQLHKSAAQKKLLDGLVKLLDFPLPPSLVEDRIDRLIKDLEYRLDRKGKNLLSLGKTMEQLREEYRAEAEQSARAELLLLAVADKEGLSVNPQELDAALNRLAMQTRQDFMELKRYYEENNLVVALKDRLLMDKAMEFIYSKAQRREIDPVQAESADESESKPKRRAAKKAPKAE
ncbi:trigger factor [Desulfovibrio aminophilus]|uniref:trigger factor n=1 Tax=Desulfovibrio aminophilus TaxID=81425 RepID=UPI003392456F